MKWNTTKIKELAEHALQRVKDHPEGNNLRIEISEDDHEVSVIHGTLLKTFVRIIYKDYETIEIAANSEPLVLIIVKHLIDNKLTRAGWKTEIT